MNETQQTKADKDRQIWEKLFPLPEEVIPFALKGLWQVGLMVLLLWGYHEFYATRIVTADILGFNLEQATALAKGEIQEAEALARIDRIKDLLSQLRGNRIVIRKDMVISSNGEEIFLHFSNP